MPTVIDGSTGIDQIQDGAVQTVDLAAGAVSYVKLRAFTSSAQAISSAGLLTLAHGLGGQPRQVEVWLLCVTAEAGFSAGDRVMAYRTASDSAADTRNYTLFTDTTNIYVRFGSAAQVFGLANKSTGVGTVLTNANWTIVVEAIG